MAVRLQNSTKMLIILIIFALSVFVGFKKNNPFQKKAPNTKLSGKLIKSNQKAFTAAQNITKIQMLVKSDDINILRANVQEIIEKYNLPVKKDFRQQNNYVLFAEIPVDRSKSVLKMFRETGTLVEENKDSYQDSRRDINIDEHIKNNNFTKANIQKVLSNSNLSPNSFEVYTKQLEAIQVRIDSLQNIRNSQEHRQNYVLLYMLANQAGGGDIGNSAMMIKFAKTTLIALVIISLAAVLFYLILIMFLKLMRVIGIKSERTSSRYGGGYSYNNYGYSRKVKKIYKDKDGKKREVSSEE